MSLTLPTLKKSKTHIRIRKKCPTLPTPREIILSTPKEVVFDTSFRSAIIRAEQIQNGGRRGQKSAYRPVLGCYWRKRGASTVLFGVFWLAIERKLSLRWLVLLEQFFCPAKKALSYLVLNDSNSFMLFIFDWSVFGVRFSHCSCTPLFLFWLSAILGG